MVQRMNDLMATMRRMRPVDLLVEQLWAPALLRPDVRLEITGPRGQAPAGWAPAESYWLFPTADRARLLLPYGQRGATKGAANSYRGLRRPALNAGRTLLGAAAVSGLPLSPSVLSLLVADDSPEARAALPVAALAQALGRERLYAATGVRDGANRKATLHLFSETGRPVGFAKFGWSAATDEVVRAEAEALAAVGPVRGSARAPGLLTELDYHGHAVIVTEPLPVDVRGARDENVAAPTAQELYALCPVVRHAAIADTMHFVALRKRLSALADDPVAGPVAHACDPLIEALQERRAQVPVCERWHGDFAPWNRARDRSGQLWVWDWESSEPDAVA